MNVWARKVLDQRVLKKCRDPETASKQNGKPASPELVFQIRRYIMPRGCWDLYIASHLQGAERCAYSAGGRPRFEDGQTRGTYVSHVDMLYMRLPRSRDDQPVPWGRLSAPKNKNSTTRVYIGYQCGVCHVVANGGAQRDRLHFG